MSSRPLLPILLLTLLPQLLVNTASLAWLVKTMSFRGRRAGQLVCVLVHMAQLGPVWRMLKLVVLPDVKDAGELRLLLLMAGVLREGVVVVLCSTRLLNGEEITVLDTAILATAFVNLCAIHTGSHIVNHADTDNAMPTTASSVMCTTARIIMDILPKSLLLISRCSAAISLCYTFTWWVLVAVPAHLVMYQLVGALLDYKMEANPNQKKTRFFGRCLSVFDTVTLQDLVKGEWLVYHVMIAMENGVMLALWMIRHDVTLVYVILLVMTFSGFVTGCALYYLTQKFISNTEKQLLRSTESNSIRSHSIKHNNNNNIESAIPEMENPVCVLNNNCHHTILQLEVRNEEFTSVTERRDVFTDGACPSQDHHRDFPSLDVSVRGDIVHNGLHSSDHILNDRHSSDADLHQIHDSSGYFSRGGNSCGSVTEVELRGDASSRAHNEIESLSTIDLYVPQVNNQVNTGYDTRSLMSTASLPGVPQYSPTKPFADHCFSDSDMSSHQVISPEKSVFLKRVTSPENNSQSRTPMAGKWSARKTGHPFRVCSHSSFESTTFSKSSVDDSTSMQSEQLKSKPLPLFGLAEQYSQNHDCSRSTDHDETCSRSFCDMCDYITIDSMSSDDSTFSDLDGAPDMTLTWPVGRRLVRETLECLPRGKLSMQEQVCDWLRDISKPEECVQDDVQPFASPMLETPVLPGQLRRNSYEEANCGGRVSIVNWTTLNMSRDEDKKNSNAYPYTGRSNMKQMLLGLCTTHGNLLSERLGQRRNTIAHLRRHKIKQTHCDRNKKSVIVSHRHKDGQMEYKTEIGTETTI